MDFKSGGCLPVKIIVAKNAGFCFGVRRAIEALEREAEKGERIYTVGEVIHNPQTVEKLREKGVVPVDVPWEVEGKIAIPSHGGEKELIEELERRGINYLDVTCPYVTKIQKHIRNLSQEGFLIVMVGDRDHPEVRSAVSYAEGPYRVIRDVSELGDVHPRTKIALLAQTTLNLEKFSEIVKEIVKQFERVYVINTICEATRERQEEARDIASRSDCVIVVGGKKSANTRRLAEIARGIQSNTHHVETPEEISESWFEGVETVGILGGASTPDWLIEEVVSRIKSFKKEVAHGGRKI